MITIKSFITLDGYHKKKYVCKLLFIFLLGHDVDFGHIEAVNLLSSNKYTEKQIGYLFISVLLNEGNCSYYKTHRCGVNTYVNNL